MEWITNVFSVASEKSLKNYHLKDRIMTRKNNTLMGNGLAHIIFEYPTRSSSLFMELEYFEYVITHLIDIWISISMTQLVIKFWNNILNNKSEYCGNDLNNYDNNKTDYWQ